MDAFPAFFALAGQTVIVAGDGDGADAKARLFDGSPATLRRVGGAEAAETASYQGARLVFIAGEDLDFAQAAADAARAAGALVNVIDRPALSDFSTPALIDRGAVVAAIGTAGASPMLAAVLRGEIEAQIPEGAGRVAALLHQMKDEVRAAFPEMADRRAFLRDAATGPAAASAASGDLDAARRLLREAMEAAGVRTGRVHLLDGSGPVDLLSLRALRGLAEADVVIADEGCDPGVLARARRDAPRRAPEDASALAARARAGERVVRLFAGHIPGVLAAVLGEAGIEVAVLPVATA